MPEAPTIRVLAESLHEFVGKTVIAVDGSIDEKIRKAIVDNKITDIRSYGKQLLIIFKDFTVSAHLMMFGTCTINAEKKGKLTIGLRVKDGNVNFYSSSVKFIDKPLEEAFEWRSEVMNERFDKKFTLEKLKERADTVIVDALIDQDLFTGVGNKIRNEVLFRVMVHPLSKVKDIPDKKLREIIDDCVKFSFEMLEWKRDGVMDDNLIIYKRKDCPRDKMPVRHDKLGSRTIHFCEKCQVFY